MSVSTIAHKFSSARKLFPHTRKIVYFNSASYGPFCTPVHRAIKNNLDLRLASERDDGHDAFASLDHLRSGYAAMIGAPKRAVGIGMNTSFGLNLAAFGLPLKSGDEVLLSDTEFPALAYVFRGAAETRGLKLKRIQSKDKQFDIDACERQIGKRTRVLAISYVQFFNGYKNDLKRIADLCKSRDIFFVVDGIQGCGVEPIQVRRLGIDVFSSGCQKWLLAPQGCGFFYLSDRVRDQLTPTAANWLDVDWNLQFSDLFHYDRTYFDSARRFEQGFYSVLNILGMKAALDVIQNLGVSNIQKHNHELIDRLAQFVEQHQYYRVTCAMDRAHRSSIFTFTCDKVSELHQALLQEQIILVNREQSIRVSVHLFNNKQDIDRLITVLDTFAPRAQR